VDVPSPSAIELQPGEQELLAAVNFQPDITQPRAEVLRSLAAAAELAESLLRRHAIPDIRWRYFTDPELNVGGHGKSRRCVFEENGCKGRAILRHPHFLKYLRYFIFGPDLPRETVERFRQVVVDDAGTSGEVLGQLRSVARAEARRLGHPRVDLREEFLKLALECGLDDFVALSVRSAVGSAR